MAKRLPVQQVCDSADWIALLARDERAAWQRGDFDSTARRLGVTGWIVPLVVCADGGLAERFQPGGGLLPAAPILQLKSPLTPKAELHLVNQLRRWWQHPLALRLWGRPLLVLQGAASLSHPGFALKRLRLMAPGLLVFSRDPGSVQQVMGQGFDGQIQGLSPGSIQSPPNYLQQLRSAHHRMEPEGLWLPAVQALSPAHEPLWFQGTAAAYQEWLLQATAWSRLRFLGQKCAPVWIENWQGHQRWWADDAVQRLSSGLAAAPEGAKADQRAAEKRCWGECQSRHVAVMVHGFYLEKLTAMLRRLPAGGGQQGLPGLDLYVSTPLGQLDEAEALLRDLGWPRVQLVGTANRGRDIAPFLLELLPAAIKQGHTAFVKLHTKASLHLQKGEDWGQHLVDALLHPRLLATLTQTLQRDPSLGLLAPAGTVLPISVALQTNAQHLQALLQSLGWSGQWALQQSFVAGSMMAGRLQALKPLIDLPLTLDHFEADAGQTDGTLAHALERWISLVVADQRLRLEEIPGAEVAVPRFGYGWIGAQES